MEPSWLETYYTALEFFYWEPQHLGRKKIPDAKLDSLDKVAKRLRELEVTLTHNLDQFLRLAPNGLRNELFESVFGRSFLRPFHMHGRHVDDDFDLLAAMQPDFLFESDSDVVSIEMKIHAKSSVSQVLKYALLGLAVEMMRQAPRQHSLVMLGRGTFADLWKEDFRDVAELRNAIAVADLPAFLQGRTARFRPHIARFTQIVQGLQIEWLPYWRLANLLRAAYPPDSDASRAAEVYRKLLDGMLNELSNRQLAQEAGPSVDRTG